MGTPQDTIKFMFLDNRPLEYLRGFSRRMCSPVKCHANPLLEPARPWEYNRVMLYGSVLRDPETGRYRMWYTTSTHEPAKIDYLLLAESSDGYAWERPCLDVVAGTNIVLDGPAQAHGPTVIRDDAERDASMRYKMMMRPRGVPAVFGYLSPDGIHWRKVREEPVIAANSDCHIGLYRDAATGLYQASFRADCPDRRIWRSESEDFLHWRRPVLVLEPDIADPVQTQLYGMQMTPYGAYVLGWLHRYSTWESDLCYSKTNGNWDIELAWSRDGYCWHRPFQGQDFLSRGGPGSWEGGLISPASSPVFLEDEIRFYYAACANQHGDPYQSKRFCIGAASLPPDRFSVLSAGETGAELMTRPFATAVADLFVNADVQGGSLTAAVLDGEARSLPGYSFEDCIPTRESGTCVPIRWKGGAGAVDVLRRPIRLALRATDARLHSITFARDEAAARRYREWKEIRCLDPMKDLA